MSTQRERLVLGLSNLNSAVAAVLLQRQGFQVMAVYFDWAPVAQRAGTFIGCLTRAQEERKAWVTRIAKQLSLPLTVVPAFEHFEETVLDELTHDLLQTRFRNPCITCHSTLKLGLLNRIREQHQLQWMATGHFAQIRHETNGIPHLYRGSDASLDQSDLLSRADIEHLKHLQAPLGGLSAANIRKLAVEFDLVEATLNPKAYERRCVWQDPALQSIIEERAATTLVPRGTVQTLAGEVVGDHAGLYLHPLGQSAQELHLIERQLGEGLSVIAHEPGRKAVIIGPASSLQQSNVMLESLTWLQPAPPLKSFRCLARFSGISNRVEMFDVTIVPYGLAHAHMQFHLPHTGVYLGQSVILYQGDEVIGEGSVQRLGGPDHA